MNFLFADKSYSNKAILDSRKLPKYYKIPPDIYEVVFQNNIITIKLNQEVSLKKHDFISKKIESLIYELVNASKGYKDCEMTPARFIRILSAFTNDQNSPALNFSYNQS
jgi:hypothetical protein